MSKDYRSEQISYLRSIGKSDKEIEALVPKTRQEREKLLRQKALDQAALIMDVEMLKAQVKELRLKVFNESYVTDISQGSA